MSNTKHRFGLEALRKREAALACRADTVRTLGKFTGITTAVVFVLATLASRDLVTALVAASPFAVVVAGMGWEAVTRSQLRKVRVLIAVLDCGVCRHGRAAVPPAARGFASPGGSRSRPGAGEARMGVPSLRGPTCHPAASAASNG